MTAIPPAPAPDILTDDTFYDGCVRLTQPRHGYRFGTDAMLLAGCVPLNTGGRVLELGCGVGAVLHALAFRARRDGIKTDLHGIEREAEIAALARQNAAGNGFELTITTGDVAEKSLRTLGLFDQIVCNPPFHPAQTHPPSRDAYRTAAHQETADGLAQWLQAANRFLKSKGRFTMIHRADRLSAYLPLCAAFLGDITLIPFWPQAGVPAKRLVLTGRKGAKGGLTLHPGLVLHDRSGHQHTAEAEAVICQGHAVILK